MSEPTARPARRRASRRAVGGLLLVCLAGLAGVLLLGLEAREQRLLERDRQAALQAARQAATNLTSISHRSADDDIERILDVATGELAEQFRSEREALTALLGSSRSTSEGEVLAAGVQSLEGRSATVLVAADATVTTAETGEDSPVLQRYRMSVDLRKVGDRWLAERVLFAGAPA
ncbi:MAG TPA: mammalian cell entry protein [Mycobacteriales bacterium]|nr:mammalian cell entry protein [Mycobacteriales bacterium]